MLKIKKYQTAITEILEDYAAYFKEPDLDTQVICDFKRNHFELVKMGWQSGKRFHYCIFHFDILDGKIWIQENNTDISITPELEAKGISKADIVLGVLSPRDRAYVGV